MFKAGDQVRVLQNEVSARSPSDARELEPGEVITVKKLAPEDDEPTWIEYDVTEDYTNIIPIEDVELVPPGVVHWRWAMTAVTGVECQLSVDEDGVNFEIDGGDGDWWTICTLRPDGKLKLRELTGIKTPVKLGRDDCIEVIS